MSSNSLSSESDHGRYDVDDESGTGASLALEAAREGIAAMTAVSSSKSSTPNAGGIETIPEPGSAESGRDIVSSFPSSLF